MSKDIHARIRRLVNFIVYLNTYMFKLIIFIVYLISYLSSSFSYLNQFERKVSIELSLVLWHVWTMLICYNFRSIIDWFVFVCEILIYFYLRLYPNNYKLWINKIYKKNFDNPTRRVGSGWVVKSFGLGWVTNPTNPNFWVGSKKSHNPTRTMYTPTFNMSHLEKC